MREIIGTIACIASVGILIAPWIAEKISDLRCGK